MTINIDEFEIDPEWPSGNRANVAINCSPKRIMIHCVDHRNKVVGEMRVSYNMDKSRFEVVILGYDGKETKRNIKAGELND